MQEKLKTELATELEVLIAQEIEQKKITEEALSNYKNAKVPHIDDLQGTYLTEMHKVVLIEKQIKAIKKVLKINNKLKKVMF